MSVFYTWWFEPALVTACFAFFINWYWYYERNVYQVSAASTFRSTVYWDMYNGPLLQSFLSYWIGIYFWTHIVPPSSRNIPDGIPQNLSDCGELILQIGMGIIYYDAIFFVLHWMMHEIPIFRRFHARHHDYQVIQRSTSENGLHSNVANRLAAAETKQGQRETKTLMMECRQTLCHSFVDGALQVLVNILVQRQLWIPMYLQSPQLQQQGGMIVMTWVVKSRLARVIHNVIIIWMLTESHSAAPTPYIWRRYFIGCREHYIHHTMLLNSKSSTGAKNGIQQHRLQRMRYQQFFGYLDDLRFAISDRSFVPYSNSVRQKSA